MTASRRVIDFSFLLDWAEDSARQHIFEQLPALHRQTMNLRLPTAKLMYMRVTERTAGWAGLDIDHDPEFPELFSLYLHEDYRRYTVGLVLELARYTYLLHHGITRAYVRMESEANFSLLRYRVSSGFFTLIDRAALPARFVERCHRCELFGKECATQAYFAVDVKMGFERGLARIGPVDVESFPLRFQMRPEVERRSERPLHPGSTRYRPYWT
jgi:N-acetylglutamate synthase-like GNAT family acetyltransferase